MVYAPERPAEFIHEPEDRPNGRSIFMDSRLFYLDNYDVLGDPEVQVHQQQEGETNRTVFVDTSAPNESFRWQLVTADGTGRTVEELAITKDGELSGWRARYNQAGVLESSVTSEPEALGDTWTSIHFVITSPEFKDFTDKKRTAREAHEESLGRLIVSHQVSNGESIVKLERQAYKDELARREERVKKSGLMAVRLATRPTLPEPQPYYFQGKLFNPDHQPQQSIPTHIKATSSPAQAGRIPHASAA